ncbi:MAG: DUF1508 domain-containing protein [Planctomycetota bacterium]|nr:MAG: DUF1508 domain-containing protein [Planctomycetota bacterium]
MSAKFEIRKSTNAKYYFNLKAGNGEIILTSEMYEAKASAIHGIESVKNNAGQEARFHRKTSQSGQPYFNLVAANGEVIGTSEMYDKKEAMENGILSVSKNAEGAESADQT